VPITRRRAVGAAVGEALLAGESASSLAVSGLSRLRTPVAATTVAGAAALGWSGPVGGAVGTPLAAPGGRREDAARSRCALARAEDARRALADFCRRFLGAAGTHRSARRPVFRISRGAGTLLGSPCARAPGGSRRFGGGGAGGGMPPPPPAAAAAGAACPAAPGVPCGEGTPFSHFHSADCTPPMLAEPTRTPI
jgi:hypothetical protein